MRTASSATLASLMPDWAHRPLISVQFAKEIRALTPIAFFGTIAVLLSAIVSEDLRMIVTLLGYTVTCAAIGAMAFGHDFQYRTLTSVLAQPVERNEIWRRRMTAALVAMLPVCVACATILLWPAIHHWSADFVDLRPALEYAAIMILAPMLTGLFFSPWLALISRNVLFGAVISLAIPYGLVVVAMLTMDVLAVADRNLWLGRLASVFLPVLWIAGGLLTHRVFSRLEAIDGAGAIQQASPGVAITVGRRRHAYGQLALKELRLQQIPIAITLGAILMTLFFRADNIALWTMVYCPIAAALFGAVPSADERQLGTAEWQILVPVAYWKQWFVKVVVALSLSAILAAVLPIAVIFWRGHSRDLGPDDLLHTTLLLAGFAVMLTSFNLYISSLHDSPLRTVIVSLPTSILACVGVIRGLDLMFEMARDEFRGSVRTNAWDQVGVFPYVVLIGSFLALALYFAGQNHRYGQRSFGRVLFQLFLLTAYFLGGNLLIALWLVS